MNLFYPRKRGVEALSEKRFSCRFLHHPLARTMPPAVSPLLILSVLLAFASGITLAFVASARGQQGRFGAQLGILLGAPLSIPVGVLAGLFSGADWKRRPPFPK